MVNHKITHKSLVFSCPNNMEHYIKKMYGYSQRIFKTDATCEDDYLLLGVSVSLPLLGPAERRWGLGMKEMECNTVKRNDNISTAITCNPTSKEKEI